MYVTDYKEEYFNCVVELEKKIYPPELRLGSDAMKSELSKDSRHFSQLIFDGGELVGYIIAYKRENVCYISDLNCPDKRALWLLLSVFFLERDREPWDDYIHYEAECRPMSLRLLYNRKVMSAIKITRQIEYGDYYSEGEHAYSVSFEVDYTKIKDWRMKIAYTLLRHEKMIGLDVFIDFAVQNGMSMQEMQSVKGFVLRLINAHNLSMYKMLGEKVTVMAHQSKHFKSANSARQYSKSLEANGFEEVKYFCQLEHCKYCVADSVLHFSRQSEYNNTKTYGDLSSARFFFRCMYGNGDKIKKVFVIYDKYGAVIPVSAPPYCNSRTWDVLTTLVAESRRLDNQYTSLGVTYGYDYMNQPSARLKDLAKAIGFRNAVTQIEGIIERKQDKHIKGNSDNYMHDWNVLIDRLLENKALLTKGAITACLGGSYNAAVKKAEIIGAISSSVKETVKGRKRAFQSEFMKDTRKRLSSSIRNGCDIGELAREILEKTAKLNAARYHLTKKETETVDDFIQRMGRYIPYMDNARLFSILGRSWLKQILSGNVNSVFKPKEYKLGNEKLCEDILELLQTRTKQVKQVYSDLKKAGCIKDIIERTLTDIQRAEVMRVLKLHNCKISGEATSTPDFSAKIEPKCSPEYLVAGNATVCCMSFGTRKALDYAREEGFGIFNVYYKDRIIANSVLWIDENYNCLVLDNIEVHPNYKVYNCQIEQLYVIAVSDMLEEYRLNFAVQGCGYSDLNLKNVSDVDVKIITGKARKVKQKHFYSDAGEAYIVCSTMSDDRIRELHTQALADAA